MCRARKLGQMAAYFLNRAEGHTMEHVKLMKLMYLADRLAIKRFGFSISDDDFYAMRAGPVLSKTLDLMSDNGDAESQKEWGKWVSAKASYKVSLQKKAVAVAENDLDEISDEEIAVMEKIFEAFGNWERSNLIEYTHKLKEWRDPGDSRYEITLRMILEALGESEDKIKEILAKREREVFVTHSPLPVLARQAKGFEA